MPSNRKIVNATPTELNGIKFKSRLEATIYRYLVDSGYQPQYEINTFILHTGVKPIGFIKDGKICNRKFTDITYTPDFKIEIKKDRVITVYIEVKGFNNDVYPYKRKLFLSFIRNIPYTYFFEVHSKKGLIACLNTLSQLYETISST